MEKKELRSFMLKKRERLKEPEIKEKSDAIREKLNTLEEYRRAEGVLFFLSFGTEVRTETMVRESLASGRIVVVPQTDRREKRLILSRLLNYEEDLYPGTWGIPEPRPGALRPVDLAVIDLVIVPGLAFDREGGRLGYGGGYYDRLFPELKAGVPLVALAFSCQLVAKVPLASHDKKIDFLITEKEILRFSVK